MILAEVFALCCNEPNRLLPQDVRRLTLRQVFGIYQWPRDGDGALIYSGPPAAPAESYRAVFYRTWRARRLAEHHIDRKWREQEDRDRGRH